MVGGVPLFPESASRLAGQTDTLYLFLVAFSAFLSLLICILIVGFAVKYRRRAPNEIGAPISGSLTMEIGWIVGLFVIAMFIFVWGAQIYFQIVHPPPGAMQISVVAKQWMWKLQHPEGQTEINELHVPVNRNVTLTMISQDVIHSFFIPAFRIKADVLPGRYTTVWFHATKPGRYHIFCAEYCGTNHSRMGGWVTVMEPTEFESWLAGGRVEQPLAEAGAVLFQRFACANCHRTDGAGRGPSLVGLSGASVRLTDGQRVTADDDYIRESILNPQAKIVAGYPAIMPAFQRLLDEQQVMQLVAYIKSLAPQRLQPQTTGEPPERMPPGGRLE